MTERVKVTIDVTADVKDGYGPHELADAVRFHLNQSELDAIEADISAIDIVDAREAHREIQPGDLVEHIYQDLDPREVVVVGRDFLTLDILGKESGHLPKDNYRTAVPAEGRL